MLQYNYNCFFVEQNLELIMIRTEYLLTIRVIFSYLIVGIVLPKYSMKRCIVKFFRSNTVIVTIILERNCTPFHRIQRQVVYHLLLMDV